MFPVRDGDSEQAHVPSPYVGYGGEEDRTNTSQPSHHFNSMINVRNNAGDTSYLEFSTERRGMQQHNDIHSMEMEQGQHRDLGRDHVHLALFHQQFHPSSLPSTSDDSALSAYSLSDPMAGPYKQRSTHYIMRNMEGEEEEEEALLMNPASSSSCSFLHQTDQMLQSLQQPSYGLLSTVPDQAHLQLQLPCEQNMYHHPLSSTASYGVDYYTNNNSNSNHLLMNMRSNTNYGYGGSTAISTKNRFPGGGNYPLPHAFDQEFRHAENEGAMAKALQQGATPSAYDNSVLSKTLENIGRSTASYCTTVTTNVNTNTITSTGLTGAGSHKAIGARERSFEEVCTPRPRWCPTQEQIQILESLFMSGTTTPSRDAIVDIASQLRKYGTIAEANVFYWFQNRKARAKRKLQPPQAREVQTENAIVIPANEHHHHQHIRDHQQNKQVRAQPSSSSSSADHHHHHHGTRHNYHSCDDDPVVELSEMKKPQKSRKVHSTQKPSTNSNSATRSSASNTTTTTTTTTASGHGHGGASSSEQSLNNGNSSVLTPYPSIPGQLLPTDRITSSSAMAAHTPSSVNSSAIHVAVVEDAISDPHSYNKRHNSSMAKSPSLQASIDSAATNTWQTIEYNVNHEEQPQISAELHHHNNDDIATASSSAAAARHSYNMGYDGSTMSFFRQPDTASSSPLPSSYGVNSHPIIANNTVDHSRISLSLAPPAQNQLQAGPPLLQVNNGCISASDHNLSSLASASHPQALPLARSYCDQPPDHRFLQATPSKGFLLNDSSTSEKRVCEEAEEQVDMAANSNAAINNMILQGDHQNMAFFSLSNSSSVQTARPLHGSPVGLEFSELATNHHLHHSTQASSTNLARSSEVMPKLSSSSPLAPDQDHLQLWEEIESCGSLTNWQANTSMQPRHSQH